MNGDSSQSRVATWLTVSGALIGIGGYLSQPENLGTLSSGTAHYVAATGAVLYVAGQALRHYLTTQQVQANTKAIETVTGSTPTSNPVVQ